MSQLYDFCDDYMTILAGTSNRLARAYVEAAEHVEKDDDASVKYLKKFIGSIEKLSKSPKVNDARITKSKGFLREFEEHENIDYMLKFLQQYVKEPIVGDLKKIYDAVVSYGTEYRSGYDKNVRLVELEYESAVYMLVTGLVYTMSNCVEFAQQDTGFKIVKKAIDKRDTIAKMTSKMAKQLSEKDHKLYLSKLVEAATVARRDSGKPVAESYEGEYTIESVVGDALDLFDAITNNIGRIMGAGKMMIRTMKRTMFGILPMIRGVIYLHYKKKADHIANLEQQCAFLKMNIDQLNRRTDLSKEEKERLIKRQSAYVKAYEKKAAKIRAELNEQSRDAAASLEKDREVIQNAPKSNDDDMVLESVDDFEYLMEGRSSKVTDELQIKAWETFSKYCKGMKKLRFDFRVYEDPKNPEMASPWYFILATNQNNQRYQVRTIADSYSTEPLVFVSRAWEADKVKIIEDIEKLVGVARSSRKYKKHKYFGSGFRFTMDSDDYERLKEENSSTVNESSNLFATDPHTHMNDDDGVLDEDPDSIDTKPNKELTNMEIICNDPNFGEMKYKHRWYKTETVRFFNKEWQVTIAAKAYSGKPITDQQRNSYSSFKKNEDKILVTITEIITTYINENYEELSSKWMGARMITSSSDLANITIPKTFLFKQNGDFLVLFDCVWDIEHGLAVQVFPEYKIGTQDCFL